MHGSDTCLTSMTATTQKLVMAVEYGIYDVRLTHE